jgi:hypothetical protein
VRDAELTELKIVRPALTGPARRSCRRCCVRVPLRAGAADTAVRSAQRGRAHLPIISPYVWKRSPGMNANDIQHIESRSCRGLGDVKTVLGSPQDERVFIVLRPNGYRALLTLNPDR